VLFSDGQPSDTFRRDAVCAEAVRLDVVVHSIGLGPASDIAENDPGAVEEMRAIANCTGGAYAGIAPGGSTTIDAVYQALATATSQGSLTYTVRMSGEGFEGLASGDRISGRFRIEGGGEEAEAPFQFTVR
jgi:hypothetical protein